jgi:hypothetical protein
MENLRCIILDLPNVMQCWRHCGPRWTMWTYSGLKLIYLASQLPPLIIITMARQPYMGLGLLFRRLRGLFLCICSGEGPAHWPRFSTRSWCDCQSHLAVSQETWVRNGARGFIECNKDDDDDDEVNPWTPSYSSLSMTSSHHWHQQQSLHLHPGYKGRCHKCNSFSMF